jgi:hypothetical protein
MNTPDPMTPADSDLRDFPAMLLDVVRLRDSDLAGADNAEVFRASVISWCVAWHQLPAASLPDDDSKLARLLGYGKDVRAWKKVRDAGGLRGWILCTDGRLYHPVVAEKAVAAIASRAKQREKTEAARAAKAVKDAARRASTDEPSSGGQTQSDHTAQNTVTVSVTDNVRTLRTEADTATATSSKVSEGKVSKEEERIPVASLPRASDDCDEAVAAWNQMAEQNGLSRVSKLTDTRRRSLRQRLNECDGIEGWSDAMRLVTESPHLLGHSRGGWKADFDFVLQQRSFVKLMEGAYGNRGQGQPENGWDLYDRHVEQEAARESDRLSH